MDFDRPWGLFRRGLLQAFSRAARVLGSDCVLCGGPGGEAMACARCAEALPRTAAPCPRCALPMPQPGLPCGRCLRVPSPLDSAVAAFEYRFPVDRLVQRFKFAGDLATGRWLALRLAESTRDRPRPDLLVAPPLARDRLAARGFNQALEVARTVGAELAVPVALHGIVKVRATAPQPGLGRRAREANLRGTMRCHLALAGAAVAIVDDVLTTGATAREVARALKEAGAGHVSAWVIARTPGPRR